MYIKYRCDIIITNITGEVFGEDYKNYVRRIYNGSFECK